MSFPNVLEWSLEFIIFRELSLLMSPNTSPSPHFPGDEKRKVLPRPPSSSPFSNSMVSPAAIIVYDKFRLSVFMKNPW